MQLNKIICKACQMNHHQAPVWEQIILEAFKHFQLYSNGNLFMQTYFHARLPYLPSITNILVKVSH